MNQIGGQDELVFDGNSFVIDDGKLTFIASDVFDNSYPLVDIGSIGIKITTPKREIHKCVKMNKKEYGIDDLVEGGEHKGPTKHVTMCVFNFSSRNLRNRRLGSISRQKCIQF